MKMKKLIYICLVTCLMGTSAVLKAQDAQAGLGRMFAQFQETSYAAKITQSWFPSHQATEAVKVDQGEIKVKKDQACYHRIGDMETLFNEQYAMTMNHQMKVMMIQSFDPTQAKKDLLGLDQEGQDFSAYQFVDLDATYAKYVLEDDESRVSRVEVIFNKNTHKLTKMVYFLAPGAVYMEGIEGTEARMEMEFHQLNFNPTFQANDFSESRFVNKTESGFQMKASYRGYRLANYAG